MVSIPIRVNSHSLHVVNMWTRMPFRYGIAKLTALPHLFVSANVTVNGQPVRGLAADGLAPKWFTKDPDAPVQDEVAQMMQVIRAACAHGESVGQAGSVFDWWRAVYEKQKAWGEAKGLPPLLWHFGVSLIERAVIDALCRGTDRRFCEAVHDNALGIDLGAIHPELAQTELTHWLPTEPTRRLGARHTVGLGDPLTDDQIDAADRLDDGLPQSLEACIDRYGLTYFKIKVPADAAEARARMQAIREVVTRKCKTFAFTLDGNEFFQSFSGFTALWRQLVDDPAVRDFFDRGLLFVEQPVHRQSALSDDAAATLSRWPNRPPIIIDESDGSLESLPRALACGYAGTSHKNCKGVIKGLANACLIEKRRRDGQAVAFSGEDLSNVGPVALLQDLAVAATMGLSHLERNGHHYFAGLSALPDAMQQQMIDYHGDLYGWHAHSTAHAPAVQIEQGVVAVDSVLAAPFGYQPALDLHSVTPLASWTYASLGLDPPTEHTRVNDASN
jgi:hypothetical protein